LLPRCRLSHGGRGRAGRVIRSARHARAPRLAAAATREVWQRLHQPSRGSWVGATFQMGGLRLASGRTRAGGARRFARHGRRWLPITHDEHRYPPPPRCSRVRGSHPAGTARRRRRERAEARGYGLASGRLAIAVATISRGSARHVADLDTSRASAERPAAAPEPRRPRFANFSGCGRWCAEGWASSTSRRATDGRPANTA
jgi:hypothetical protein